MRIAFEPCTPRVAEFLGNKSSIYQFKVRGCPKGGIMTTLQAICLGAMLAWTPSLVVLALLLRETPLDEVARVPS
jgi:hypothetical protein